MHFSDCFFIDHIDDLRLVAMFLGMFDDRQQRQYQTKQQKDLDEIVCSGHLDGLRSGTHYIDRIAHAKE